ncbi:MAG: Aspartate aminotransferase, partial [uncultured Thermomicrobiales bacterium]
EDRIVRARTLDDDLGDTGRVRHRRERHPAADDQRPARPAPCRRTRRHPRPPARYPPRLQRGARLPRTPRGPRRHLRGDRPGEYPHHHRRDRGELSALQHPARSRRSRRRGPPSLPAALQRPARDRLRRAPLVGTRRGRAFPLRPRRIGTARHAAHAPDRRQHAAQPDRRDPLRRQPPAGLRPGGVGRSAGPLRRGVPLARTAGRRAAASADPRPRRQRDQRRHLLQTVRAAGPADRLDRRARRDRRRLLGDARLHHPQPRQAERCAGPPGLSTPRQDHRADSWDRRGESGDRRQVVRRARGDCRLDATARRAPRPDALPPRHPFARAGRPPRRRIQRDARARRRLRLRVSLAPRCRSRPGNLRHRPRPHRRLLRRPPRGGRGTARRV